MFLGEENLLEELIVAEGVVEETVKSVLQFQQVLARRRMSER